MENEFYGIDFSVIPQAKASACPGQVLAMAYVPMQEFGKVYEPDQAFMAGTLFPELDKPFEAGMQRG